jgi:hypothetical protein
VSKENSFGILAALLVGLSSQTAWAIDPPAETPVEAPVVTSRADTLFSEGKQLMEQGKFVEACDKLAESDALDPAIGTLGLLATCHEQQGRIATAWREYSQTAARADAVADERGTFARERAKALEAELPKLLVRLAVVDTNVVVLRNGVRLLPEEYGVASPIDPGTYEIVARWPDKPEFRTTVTVLARKLSEVEVPNPSASVGVAKVEVKPVVVAPKLSGLSGQHVGALIAGGVGLVGFGVGTAFAISAASKNSASISIQQSCNSVVTCQDGKSLREQATTAATIANVGVGLGIVGAGTAIVLALLPNRSSSAVSDAQRAVLVPFAARDGAGALLVGHF